MVYATPEILLRPKSYFQQVILRGENTFRQNLTLIAMDEAHTVWGYRRFRSEFKHLGKLRKVFPDIPFAALSATLPPHIMSCIHETCALQTPCDLITTKGRRKNINLIVTELESRNNFEPMLELIPNAASDTAAEDPISDKIPQTMVFVDSVVTARKLAIALRRRLIRNSGSHKMTTVESRKIIRTYYSSIDVAMKLKTHELIQKGIARLVICTDSMSLGVDFDAIQRVIQWGI